MTTSPHLPLCADSAALWELLPHSSLSSFKLGVRYWKEDRSLNMAANHRAVWTHQIFADHSIMSGTTLHPRAWSHLSFSNFCERYKVMSEIELGVIVHQMGDLTGETQTVMVSLSLKTRVLWGDSVNQRAMKAATMLLESCSNVSSVTGRRQRNPKCIDMHASSDTDDSLGFQRKSKLQYKNYKKRYLALPLVSLYNLI